MSPGLTINVFRNLCYSEYYFDLESVLFLNSVIECFYFEIVLLDLNSVFFSYSFFNKNWILLVETSCIEFFLFVNIVYIPCKFLSHSAIAVLV